MKIFSYIMSSNTKKKKLYFGLFFILVFLYFFSRFIFLKNLPIFVDEATHIHWAQLGFYDPNQRLVSLHDGKQPLFIWLIIFMMHFISNPLIAGRLAAILSGFGAAVAMMLLTYELFHKKEIALLSMLFYILCPFPLLLDRITIFDSLVTFLSLLSLYFSIRLIKKIELQNTFLLAFSLGAGILTKSTGFLSIYLLPFSLILFNYKSDRLKNLIKWIGYVSLSIIIAFIYYSVLRLSSNFSNITAKNNFFLNSPLWLLHFTFIPLLISNITIFSVWIWLLLSPPLLLLISISIVQIRSYWREKIILLSTFFTEIIALALLVRYPNPRYIFFMTMFLIPLAAMGVWHLYVFLKKKKNFFLAIIFALLLYVIAVDYQIVTNLEYAPVPQITKVELVTGWPAGGGMSKIVKYLLSKSKKEHILVVTDGIYGGASSAVMDVYFFQNYSVDRVSLDSFSENVPSYIREKQKKEPVYLFLDQLKPPFTWNIHKIFKIHKGHGSNYVYLYKLNN